MDSIVVSGPLILSGPQAEREARARQLVTVFVKFLDDHVDELVQVRTDFFEKPKHETIMGCYTWSEFCRNVLHYSESHLRRLLAGKNPATPIHDGSKNRLPSPEPPKLFEGPWETISLRLGDVGPNPFRKSIGHGVLNRKRIAFIKWLDETTFHDWHWFYQYAYGHKTEQGFQLIDGHHSLEAAKQLYGPEHQVEFQYKTCITDEQMAHGLYAGNLQSHDGFLPWSMRERIDFIVMLSRQYFSGKFPCNHAVPGSAECVAGHINQDVAWPRRYVEHLLQLSRLDEDVLEAISDLDDPLWD